MRHGKVWDEESGESPGLQLKMKQGGGLLPGRRGPECGGRPLAGQLRGGRRVRCSTPALSVRPVLIMSYFLIFFILILMYIIICNTQGITLMFQV